MLLSTKYTIFFSSDSLSIGFHCTIHCNMPRVTGVRENWWNKTGDTPEPLVAMATETPGLI